MIRCRRTAGRGKPLRIADEPYSRGLYCHAPSQLEVRLPGPAESFTAIIGVDSNSQTSGGRGSVEFAVTVDDQERFRSGVMREGMTGQPVRVNLGGASAFVLRVEPTADGIACDQADWAEAKVTLRDGREVWLADLPLRDSGPRAPYTSEPPFSFIYGGQPSAGLLKDWEVTNAEQWTSG